MGKRMAAVVVVGFLVVAGCGDDDDASSAEQIIGTWENDTRATHTFESDETFAAGTAYSASGDPGALGTYTFDGSILTFDTNNEAEEGTGVCNLTIGSYEVTFSDSDTMSWALIDDECATRWTLTTASPWVRVEDN